mmetsp:Transcript_1100/g.3341  ORF Transcript_1100/g.3341 Transcript_1100/m.3341 type:complete len:276 (-) Transcript_1100:90-917(-)
MYECQMSQWEHVDEHPGAGKQCTPGGCAACNRRALGVRAKAQPLCYRATTPLRPVRGEPGVLARVLGHRHEGGHGLPEAGLVGQDLVGRRHDAVHGRCSIPPELQRDLGLPGFGRGRLRLQGPQGNVQQHARVLGAWQEVLVAAHDAHDRRHDAVGRGERAALEELRDLGPVALLDHGADVKDQGVRHLLQVWGVPFEGLRQEPRHVRARGRRPAHGHLPGRHQRAPEQRRTPARRRLTAPRHGHPGGRGPVAGAGRQGSAQQQPEASREEHQGQ